MVKPLSTEGWPDRDYRGKWYKRSSLLRQRVRTTGNDGSNHFPYSESTGWTCTASDAGLVSRSNTGFWIRTNMDNTTTHKGGTQSFQGTGRLSADDTVDCSTWSYAYMFAFAGFWFQDTDPVATVTLGARTNSTDYEFRTDVDFPNCSRVGGTLDMSTVPVADRGTMQFYFEVTCPTATSIWFIDRKMLNMDVQALPRTGVYIRTNGTAKPSVNKKMKIMPLVTSPKFRQKRLDIRNEYKYYPDEREKIPEDLGVD